MLIQVVVRVFSLILTARLQLSDSPRWVVSILQLTIYFPASLTQAFTNHSLFALLRIDAT